MNFRIPMRRLATVRAFIAFGASVGMSLGGAAIAQQDVSHEGALERFTADLKYLASDELAGRLPGTPEMETCLKFIVDDFKKSGLKPGMPDGTYLQTFDVGRRNSVVADKTSFGLVGPKDKMDLALGKEFSVQLKNNSYDVTKDLVFVGYGINASEHNFNEYAGVDVKDKFVIVMRMEPQQDNPDSVFDGAETSDYASIRNKVASAVEAGAAGIVFVNDGKTVTNEDADKDELSAGDLFGNSTGSLPFVHVKRAVIDKILAQAPLTKPDGKKFSKLAEIEKFIDESLEPVSQPIEGWKATAKAEFKREEIMTSNIIGVIDGEGDLAEETLVIGGHYDHLGMGAFGSRSPNRGKEIHNGADDNATGTAGIMELVRRFQSRDGKPKRRLVFICFTAEEMGLLGAQHYVANPVYPLKDTIAMVNYDMIGWLRDDKLTVYDWESSPEFAGALDRANEGMGLNLIKPNGGFAGSDHLPFKGVGIPVMFLHTGLTSTYHTPEDDFESIDCNGAVKVIDYTERLIDELANLDSRPTFGGGGGGSRVQRVRLGAQLETIEDGGGVKIVGITEDSMAAKAGLKEGDIIKKIGDEATAARRDVIRIVSSNSGKKVKFTVDRSGTESVIEVNLKND